MTNGDTVFISYSRKDSAAANELRDAIQSRGVRCWIDETEIVLGDNFTRKTSEALLSSKYFLPLLTPNYMNGKWTNGELDAALNLAMQSHTTVLPVYKDNPDSGAAAREGNPLLSSRHGINWEDGGPEFVADQVVQALENTSDRLSICVLSSEYPPRLVGGLGIHVSAMAQTLSNSCRLTLVLPPEVPEIGKYIRPDTANVTLAQLSNCLPSYGDPISWLQFADEASARVDSLIDQGMKIDVVQCHDWVTVLAGVKIRYRHQIPLVFHVHLPNRTPLCASIENLGLAVADTVTVNSEAIRADLLDRQREMDFSIRQISVVANGVDTKVFTPSDDDRSDGNYILFVGRLVEQKGCEYLIRAMPYIMQKFPAIRLKIVGDGQLGPTLERLSTNLLVSENVDFLGPVGLNERSRLADLYRNAQVIVVPSIYEPFGMTALEGLASRKPVVASRTGGLAELVIDRQTGILVEPGDDLDLAQWVMHLLTDEDSRLALSKAGYEHVRTRYSWDAAGGTLLQILNEVRDRGCDRVVNEASTEFTRQIESIALAQDPPVQKRLLDNLFAWGDAT